MSPSEIAFLALGMVVGAALGLALAGSGRRGRLGRREIRLTITPNAIPSRRAGTLAVPHGTPHPGPIPGSPDAVAPAPGLPAAAMRGSGATMPAHAAAAPVRTRVLSASIALPSSAVAVPVGIPAAAPRPAGGDVPRASVVALAARWPSAQASAAVAPDGSGGGITTLVRPRRPVEDPRPTLPAQAVPVTVGAPAVAPGPRLTVRTPQRETRLESPTATGGAGPGDAASPRGSDATAPAAGDEEAGGTPCAGPRRLVDERCALASVAREQARLAVDALQQARRAYDVLRERVDRAEAAADPRHVAAEKDRLHAAFRAATDQARGSDETEAAARAWLDELNRLNAAVRDAQRLVETGGAELRAAHPALERRSVEADAARIAADNADDGCREAREALAACEEAEEHRRRSAPAPDEDPHPFERVWPVDRPDLPVPQSAPAERLAGLPMIVRVLHGDRAARDRLVETLAAGDATADRATWQLRLSRLVDAIAARAIEDGYLDLPADDPFWRLFEPRESRDIVGALSALGFRYDGMAGFADGRVPTARDLSLAVGYAGLDRMRIRTWPRDADIAALYARAVVASDEWLADEAGDLSLGELVDALGARAAELADLWNAWGRVRPALLAS